MAADRESKSRKLARAETSTRRAAAEVGSKWRANPSQPPLEDDDWPPDSSADPPALSEDAEISIDGDAVVDVDAADVELLDGDPEAADDVPPSPPKQASRAPRGASTAQHRESNYGRAALLVAGLLVAGVLGALLSRVVDGRSVPATAPDAMGRQVAGSSGQQTLPTGTPGAAPHGGRSLPVAAASEGATPLAPGTVPRLASADAGSESADASAGSGIDETAVSQALERSARAATKCPAISEGSPSSVTVAVTFAPNGRASNATLTGGPLVGTYTGNCVTHAFLAARVPAFTGDFATFQKTVRLR